MAIEYNLNDMQKRRRKKKLVRFAKKAAVVLVIALIGVLLYVFRSKWMPLFEGIGTKYENSVRNSGELAKENFPIKIRGTSDHEIDVVENYLTYLDDTHFYMYSVDGELVAERQHSYSSPVLKSGHKRSVIYDCGGKKLKVESKQKTIYEKEFSGNIILAELSGNDSAAVVSESDGFACVMNIYNPDGSERYTIKNVEGRIIDVDFYVGSSGCIAVNVGVEGGKLVSSLSKYDFSKTEPNWHSSPVDTFAVSAEIMQNGDIAVFGDTKFAYYSKDGELIGTYEYPYQLSDFSAGISNSAILLQREEFRKSTLVIINDVNNPVTVELDKTAKGVYTSEKEIYVLTTDELIAYSFDGVKIDSINVSDNYTGFVKIDDYVFLNGYNEINRTEFAD
ncbi:MAG: hypothetical protein IKL70_06305 [Oscillospiraceae bacterium]|nr:hypothetical protein [Oscillospiraceae bacterium]